MFASVLIIFAVVLLLSVYGWFEAGWLKTRVLDLEIDRLPAALDGVRIAHLSDFHLGARLSRGNVASARAVAWVAARAPNLVCVTGDLVSHPRGEPRLRHLLASLDHPFVVLGNHDVAMTRDPFSRAAELRDLEDTRLLQDEVATVDVAGACFSIVGVDPGPTVRSAARRTGSSTPSRTYASCSATSLRSSDRISAGSFDLVLAGHLHAGQVCLPLPGRRITLAHPRARFVAGVYKTGAGIMHVSPGTGTTFVPLRFFARPEVTELVLRRPA